MKSRITVALRATIATIAAMLAVQAAGQEEANHYGGESEALVQRLESLEAELAELKRQARDQSYGGVSAANAGYHREYYAAPPAPAPHCTPPKKPDEEKPLIQVGGFLQAGDSGARDIDLDRRILGDLELQRAPVLTHDRHRAVEASVGDYPVARLEVIDHLLQLALLPPLRNDDQHIEEHQHENERDKAPDRTHAAALPIE